MVPLEPAEVDSVRFHFERSATRLSLPECYQVLPFILVHSMDCMGVRFAFDFEVAFSGRAPSVYQSVTIPTIQLLWVRRRTFFHCDLICGGFILLAASSVKRASYRTNVTTATASSSPWHSERLLTEVAAIHRMPDRKADLPSCQ